MTNSCHSLTGKRPDPLCNETPEKIVCRGTAAPLLHCWSLWVSIQPSYDGRRGVAGAEIS